MKAENDATDNVLLTHSRTTEGLLGRFHEKLVQVPKNEETSVPCREKARLFPQEEYSAPAATEGTSTQRRGTKGEGPPTARVDAEHHSEADAPSTQKTTQSQSLPAQGFSRNLQIHTEVQRAKSAKATLKEKTHTRVGGCVRIALAPDAARRAIKQGFSPKAPRCRTREFFVAGLPCVHLLRASNTAPPHAQQGKLWGRSLPNVPRG